MEKIAFSDFMIKIRGKNKQKYFTEAKRIIKPKEILSTFQNREIPCVVKACNFINFIKHVIIHQEVIG